MAPDVENHLTTKQLAERLNVTPRYLEKLRHAGGGPRFVRIGSGVRYPASALREWLDANTHRSTSDAA